MPGLPALDMMNGFVFGLNAPAEARVLPEKSTNLAGLFPTYTYRDAAPLGISGSVWVKRPNPGLYWRALRL